jgi:hypothetical protein
VSVEEWKEGLGASEVLGAADTLHEAESEAGEGGGAESAELPVIEQQDIAELEDEHDVAAADTGAPLNDAERRKLRIRAVPPRGHKEVWSSKGVGGASAGSVWAPTLARPMGHANRQRVCVGHYASASHKKPSACLVLELHDASILGLQKSDFLPRAVAQLTPHPIGYRLVWSRAAGASPLYAWRPLPPSDAFVAIGFVCGSSAEPPPVMEVRCVPAAWARPSGTPPKLAWDDSGLGGKPGSLWSVVGDQDGGMALLAPTVGHQPPEDTLQLRAKEFAL